MNNELPPDPPQGFRFYGMGDTLLPKLISGEVRVPVDEEDKAAT
jgi:hypothetical protein